VKKNQISVIVFYKLRTTEWSPTCRLQQTHMPPKANFSQQAATISPQKLSTLVLFLLPLKQQDYNGSNIQTFIKGNKGR
jgi:hypothetical protein